MNLCAAHAFAGPPVEADVGGIVVVPIACGTVVIGGAPAANGGAPVEDVSGGMTVIDPPPVADGDAVVDGASGADGAIVVDGTTTIDLSSAKSGIDDWATMRANTAAKPYGTRCPKARENRFIAISKFVRQ